MFQQGDRHDSQKLNNDTFYRPVTSTQCHGSTENYPDSANFIKYNDDDYSQGYGQVEEVFGALTRDEILKPIVSDNDFGSSKNADDNGYNLNNFQKRYQKKLQSTQTIKKELKFSKNIPVGISGHALVLTKKLFNKNSNGQRHFDLI